MNTAEEGQPGRETYRTLAPHSPLTLVSYSSPACNLENLLKKATLTKARPAFHGTTLGVNEISKGRFEMNTAFRILIVITCSLYAASAFAQDERTQEFLRQQQQRRHAETLRQLDSGVYLMDQGLYERADEKFRYVLQNIKSVPSDLTFFFGKNSYFLSEYKQSIDWLNKYIQLKGTTGQYYEEATSWLAKAEAEYLKQKTEASGKTKDILSKNYDIDCGPTGKVTCPVCQGNHVIVRRGPLGDSFKTCPYCNEHGILTCEQYNKLLRGELQGK